MDSKDRRAIYDEAAASDQSVVFVGARDLTVPKQLDRTGPKSSVGESYLEATLSRPKTFFCENLDDPKSRLIPLPGGTSESASWHISVRSGGFPAISSTGPILLVSHRHRGGEQWSKRRVVSALAEGPWSEFAEDLCEERSPRAWRRMAKKFSFGVCVRGGGLSPSPKFFDLLLLGVIPIIEASPISSIHQQFPCVVVNEWSEGSLTQDFLHAEHERLRSEWRNWDRVLHTLQASVWEEFMASHGDTEIFEAPRI